MSNLQSVLETYAGKSKELIRCEEYIKDIIKMIKDDHTDSLDITRTRNVYRNAPTCDKLCKELTNFFKVGKINVYWKSGMINALTFTADSITIAERNNKQDFSTATFNICMFEELVYLCDMNEKEVLAILLHEIGHCYYTSPFMIASDILNVVLSPITSIVSMIILKNSDTILDISDTNKKQFPVFTNLFNIVTDLFANFGSLIKFIQIGFNPKTAIERIKNPNKINKDLITNDIIAKNVAKKVTRSIAMYGNERGADSFAAKYGYGPELISALRKMGLAENTIGGKIRANGTCFSDIMGDLSELTCVLYSMMSLDEHPSANQRANVIIKKLERDLKTGDYPPELKNDLEIEIERTKKIYNTLNDNKSNVAIKKAYFQIIDYVTNGHSDIREIFNVFYNKYEF